jgi:hypothetical protein
MGKRFASRDIPCVVGRQRLLFATRLSSVETTQSRVREIGNWSGSDKRRAACGDVAEVGHTKTFVPASAAGDDGVLAAAPGARDQMAVECDADAFVCQIQRCLDDLSAVAGGVAEAGHWAVVYVSHVCFYAFKMVSSTALRESCELSEPIDSRDFTLCRMKLAIRKG